MHKKLEKINAGPNVIKQQSLLRFVDISNFH